MTPLRFGFEPARLEGWLAFQRLPQVLAGHSVVVEYRPQPPAPAAPAAPVSPAAAGPSAAELAEQARCEGLPWPSVPPGAVPAGAEVDDLCALLWAAAPPGRGPSRHRCALLLQALWQHAAVADPADRRARLQAALGLDGDPAGAPAMPGPPPGPLSDLPPDLPPDRLVGRPWLQPLAGPLAGRIFVGLAGQDALAAALGEAGRSA